MTLKEFNSLHKALQEQVIANHSGPIAFREDDEHKIILRRIDDFFVEVYFKFQFDHIAKIKAFDSPDELMPWLFRLAPKVLKRSSNFNISNFNKLK